MGKSDGDFPEKPSEITLFGRASLQLQQADRDDVIVTREALEVQFCAREPARQIS